MQLQYVSCSILKGWSLLAWYSAIFQ